MSCNVQHILNLQSTPNDAENSNLRLKNGQLLLK